MGGQSAARRAAALAVLGLPTQASDQQIIEAYRRLARATHPDATGSPDPASARRFTEISDAYHLLASQPTPEPAAEPAPPIAEHPRAPAGPSDRTRVRADQGRQPRPPIVAGPVTITPSPPAVGPTLRRRR